MSWRDFVRESLEQLSEGPDIPDPFGCLIPLLPDQSTPFLLPPAPFVAPHPEFRDDLITIDIDPTPTLTRTTVPEPPDPEDELPIEEEDNLLPDPVPERALDHDEVAFEVSEATETPSPIRSTSTPRRQSVFVPETPALAEFTPEEEEEDEHVPDQDESLAVRFREIGESVISRYWYPVERPMPRLRKESQVLVAFQVRKYDRMRQAIAADFLARKEKANSMISFRRGQ
jgi:hypothetical protein